MRSRGPFVSNEPRGTALKVGPHATSHVESRQARKGATVRRSARVPWEYLTGAGSTWRSRDGRFDGGGTVIYSPRGSERRSSLGLPHRFLSIARSARGRIRCWRGSGGPRAFPPGLGRGPGPAPFPTPL